MQFDSAEGARGSTSDNVSDFNESFAIDTRLAVRPTIPSESFKMVESASRRCDGPE